jgi:membrane protease YdiL (CAAX protease family)
LFQIWGELLLYISLYFASQVFFTWLVGFINANQSGLKILFAQQVGLVLLGSILLSLFIYNRLFKARQQNLWVSCNFSKLQFQTIIKAWLLGLVYNCFFTVFAEIILLNRLFPDHHRIVSRLVGGNFWFTLLVVGMITPVFEEILFRGIVFNELRKIISLPQAIVFQGLVFGLYHMNPLQGIYGMVLGILAALVYIWVKSLWGPIMVHISFNSFSIMMSKVNISLPMNEYRIILLIVSGLIMGYIIDGLWKDTEKPYQP